jgi:hypothetical protein
MKMDIGVDRPSSSAAEPAHNEEESLFATALTFFPYPLFSGGPFGNPLLDQNSQKLFSDLSWANGLALSNPFMVPCFHAIVFLLFRCLQLLLRCSLVHRRCILIHRWVFGFQWVPAWAAKL